MLKYILISFLYITNLYAYTCEEMGYTKTIADCPDGGLKCPAQPEKMFCCDPCGWGFYYNEKICPANDGLYLAGFQCGGKWTECRGCSSEYKYNKDNCRSPKILAGSQCANAYTHCVYPSVSGCIPTVGYIYYADGSCHADYDETKTPVGVIVDAARKLMIALTETTKLTWGASEDVTTLKNYNDISTAILDFNGQENTDIIISNAIRQTRYYNSSYTIFKNILAKMIYLSGYTRSTGGAPERVRHTQAGVSITSMWRLNFVQAMRCWLLYRHKSPIYFNYRFTSCNFFDIDI